ncbi:hypothetical protein [Bacteroides ovatus]|uniref:hypothetical protein n=1 Tax=Bacteroides ovatus TaxID=28116 RepID=UPI00202EC202|nr:hypothetical protein [Bacteroides ovatus]MCM1722937.1 hypothetical protein [Bacteroides ovatus]MCM1758808.1 hypothetical protein [Bacteroides ovatus]MCM1868468.1 hypothetical protein [Bacteroides ovatus]MCM1910564.1 hypothetical protein [Bacteroides ovatus]
MGKIFIVSVVSIVLFSCCTGISSNTDKDKRYLYIEVTGTNSHGDYRAKIDTLEIMEKNDSLAYLKAFEELCVSQRASALVAEVMKEKMGEHLDEYEEVHDFRLLNEKLEEVDRSVVPDSVLAKIAQSIFSLKLEK